MSKAESLNKKAGFHRSLSARILALVSAPALLIGLAMLWQNGEMSGVLTKSLNSLSQKMETVIVDGTNIQSTLIASTDLLTAASGLSNHQQSGLLRKDQKMVAKGQKIIADLSKSADQYRQSINQLSGLDEAIRSFDDSELTRQYNYIRRSATMVPKLLDIAVDSHKRTNGLILKKDFASAQVNYIFEERFRMAAALKRITRTSDVLAQFSKGFLNKEGTEAKAKQQAILSSSMETSRSIIIYAAIALIASLGVAIFISMRTIAKPLNSSVASLSKLAAGDLDIKLTGSSITELSELESSMGVFREKLIEKEKLEAESENERVASQQRQKQAMNQMADEFEEAVGSIVQTLSSGASQQRSSTQEVSQSIAEVSSQSSTVMSVSEEGHGNIQTIAAAAEELSVSVQEIGTQIKNSADKTGNVTKIAANTVFQVSGLAETAGKIDSIVKLIEDIAGQTNLLALNATIEAARAGDAGKGFAIVAQEVKSLAGQTEAATSEIAEQIKEVQSKAELSMSATEEIQSSIEDLKSISDSIVDAINQQANATNQISQNVQYFASSNQEMTSNISTISEATKSVSQSAEGMLSASDELASTADRLSGDVQDFLNRVRAG